MSTLLKKVIIKQKIVQKSISIAKKRKKLTKIGKRVIHLGLSRKKQHSRNIGDNKIRPKLHGKLLVKPRKYMQQTKLNKKKSFLRRKQVVFDPRRNWKYSNQLKKVLSLASALKMPLRPKDFQFIYYYKKLMKKNFIPIKWPVYRVPMDMPKEYLTKQKAFLRRQWMVLFYNKIQLVRIYHWSCVKWSMRKVFFDAIAYKKALVLFQKKMQHVRIRYRKKKRIKPVDQKKEYINQKFNKKFKLFKLNAKQKKYTKYQYQLKLLQNQFLLYLKLTPYFYKQLLNYYKQFSFCSHYEKFFYGLWHRLVIILHKLRYFSPYYVSLVVYTKVLKSGLVLVNGRVVTNIYNCIWLNDNISVAYKLYCFEWLIYKQYVLLKKREWAATRKAFVKKTVYKPYIIQNIGRFLIYKRPWVFSSKRVPSSIIVNNLGKFWQKKIFPRFYNYLNLQIVSELLLEHTY